MNYFFEQMKNQYNLSDSFNMFLISPYYNSTVPVLSDVYKRQGLNLGNNFINILIFIFNLLWSSSKLTNNLLVISDVIYYLSLIHILDFNLLSVNYLSIIYFC